jgi:Chitobiase/beta-hexosaminidase C-terminal domain/6-bladed beta-propeller/HYR domain/NHL repeat
MLVLIGSITFAYSAEVYTFVRKWGSQGSDDGQFQEPVSIAIDSSGIIYVVDSGNRRIQKFDNTGNFISKWGSQGSGDGQFQRPYSIAIDSSGKVYVADLENYQIQKFDRDGTFIKKWGSPGIGNGQLNGPTGIAIDSQDNIYVAEIHNFRIQKFDSDGNFLTKWGSQGSADGQFSNLEDVAVDSSDDVYAADYLNHRIQKFDSDGNFLTKWGSQGADEGKFQGALDVAVDSFDKVYVVDLGNQRIQKFDKDGNFLTNWGSFGTEDGQFRNPFGVAVDNQGNVYVADYFNDRIQVFSKSVTVKPIVTALPVGGTYKSDQSVTLIASEQATVYYTTDGSDPNTSSPHGTSPVSGISIDKEGQTKLKFFAINTVGNVGDIQTEIYTIDKSAPVVSVPSDIDVESTSSSGAVVTFIVTAHDNLDGDVTPICTPPSGSTFPIGTTNVICEATDKAENTGTASFNVVVKEPPNPTAEPTSLSLVINPNRAVVVGQDYSLSGRLSDGITGRKLVGGQEISFMVEPSGIISIPNVKTDPSGKFSLSKLKPPDKDGTYKIVAHFAGSSLLQASESSPVFLQVEKKATSLKLQIKGNPITGALLNGELTDLVTRKSIAAQAISFTTDRSDLVINDVITDSNGKYKVSLHPLQCGTRSIQIQSHFSGSDVFKPTDSRVTVLKIPRCLGSPQFPSSNFEVHILNNSKDANP